MQCEGIARGCSLRNISMPGDMLLVWEEFQSRGSQNR